MAVMSKWQGWQRPFGIEILKLLAINGSAAALCRPGGSLAPGCAETSKEEFETNLIWGKTPAIRQAYVLLDERETSSVRILLHQLQSYRIDTTHLAAYKRVR